jgi:succinyl-CoA synthetase alpha subunit
VQSAGPNDLVVAIRSEDAVLVERLLSELDVYLTQSAGNTPTSIYRSIEAATAAYPLANLAIISIPGEYAGREARKALELGQHVFLFSNNVPVEEEVQLKQFARERRRLVMGPDCGTSLIGGVGIGFANRVRSGPVGVVGASGTGIQEFTSLVHLAGSGISHAIGTGTHDLSDEVGGITTCMGLDSLENDPETEIIAIISKPAGAETLRRLEARIQASAKPVVGCLLGLRRPINGGPNFHPARTIDEAVAAALGCLRRKEVGAIPRTLPTETAQGEREFRERLPEQRYLRGLFAGGTLCFQAQQVLQDAGLPVYSNAPLDRRYRLENPERSLEHSIIDLGDDYFTNGRPHPMIDASERRKRILREAEDPETAILLLDFILGEISSPDPVGALIGAIRQAREIVTKRGGSLPVVASICGTDLDPQGLDRQAAMLRAAGVCVFASSAYAAAFCRDLLLNSGGHYVG